MMSLSLEPVQTIWQPTMVNGPDTLDQGQKRCLFLFLPVFISPARLFCRVISEIIAVREDITLCSASDNLGLTNSA